MDHGWGIRKDSPEPCDHRYIQDKKEALQALAEYSANPYDIQNNNLTLAELYQKWTAAYFPTLESESSSRTITSAWRYCHAIHGMRIKDLRARHIKGVAGVDEYVIKRLIGHRINDITERTYTERDIEWLRSELEKIP